MKYNNMNKLIKSLLGPILFACLAAPSLALEAGQKAPNFSLDGVGSSVSLEAQAGKVVYVDFWASWCGPCRQSFPWLNEMQKRYGAQGFTVIGVNVDKKHDDAEQFLAATPARFTLAFDPAGKTPREWQVMGMPSSYIVGRDGRIRVLHTGFRDQDRAELEAGIQKALAEGAPK
jgi:cytochrome c biogenesis protein CcmG/thiol:disulfide interchange protein DsbE